MIIIAFAENTSKILPRILCHHYRHCAPIVCTHNDMIMYQFINRNHISQIHLGARDITILKAHGWKFVYMSPTNTIYNIQNLRAYSCVDLVKQVLGIQSVCIQTPYALYKHLNKK
ncbi:MAG: hypothetical protein J5679_01570 [Alphaproteobacteria bacterium]|nr:hypothetical protein [Alphaproteobacteria bacterium]